MSKLALLRSKLAGLRRRRAAVRWGTAWSGLAIAFVVAVVVAFAVDWLFNASATQRVVLWGAGIAGVLWGFWQYTRPYLGWHEDDEDVALLVERQQGIDSDLVAAMQFDTARDGSHSGSPELEDAVIDYVADGSPELDVFEGLDTAAFRRRTAVLLVAIGVAAGLVLIFPGHASAFANRMLLGRAHYPTATNIVGVTVNAAHVLPVESARADELAKARDAALESHDRLRVRLRDLGEAIRTASETSPGWWDRWFGANEPLPIAARRVERSVEELDRLRVALEKLGFSRFDDPAGPLRDERTVARMLDGFANDDDLKAVESLAGPIDLARTSAYETVAALGKLVPTVPYGKPLEVRIDVTGRSEAAIPETAMLVLTSLDGGVRTEVELKRTNGIENPYSPTDDGTRAASYAGSLPRMVDSVRYEVFAGDARTDPNVVAVVPLPAVSVELTPTPPAYAAGEVPPMPSGQLQQSVVEGSRVELGVHCANKSLASATMTIDETEHALKRVDPEGHHWKLDVDGTPLADVSAPVRFSVTAVDADGLSLERPIQGYLRIKQDRAPRISADIKYGLPIALPNAKRTLEYRASDDYGLGRISLVREILREDGTSKTDLIILERAVGTPPRERTGEYALDFAPLGLELGDQLKVTFEAVDDRGTLEPESTTSEAILFRVATEAEVLREMQKHDVKAEQALDAIQKRELGIGESP